MEAVFSSGDIRLNLEQLKLVTDVVSQSESEFAVANYQFVDSDQKM